VRRVLRVVAVVGGAIVAATVVAVVLIRRAPGAPATAAPGPGDVPAHRAATAAAAGAASAPANAPAASPPARPAVVARRKTERAAASAPAPIAAVDATDAILALRAAGETGGIAAFGLPGTEPPRPGIVVPDGFDLPPGYVRHFQVTDDGEQLPPILLFHPDYEFVDAEGQPVPVAAHRIVPPELAPPGLPIRMLEVPAAGRTP
jgi:hypothetical protein